MQLRELILCALFVALITVGTFIRIPVGSDVYTLQFLFTLLAGLLLGKRLGTIAVAVYIGLGLLGVPVFATGSGLGYIFRPTFGYLLGFIVQAWFCGWQSRQHKPSFKNLLLTNCGGMAIVYFFGLSYFYLISNFVINTPVSAWTVILYCGILQILPDFLLCIAAAGTAQKCLSAGIWIDSHTEKEAVKI